MVHLTQTASKQRSERRIAVRLPLKVQGTRQPRCYLRRRNFQRKFMPERRRVRHAL